MSAKSCLYSPLRPARPRSLASRRVSTVTGAGAESVAGTSSIATRTIATTTRVCNNNDNDIIIYNLTETSCTEMFIAAVVVVEGIEARKQLVTTIVSRWFL